MPESREEIGGGGEKLCQRVNQQYEINRCHGFPPFLSALIGVT
jgi:hypothetical protein